MTTKVTMSGRLANVASCHLPALMKWFTRRQVASYSRSGGTKANGFQGRPTFLLTVTGRTSGEPRTVMLMLVRRGEDLLVCGSQGGSPQSPNWWKNLVAAGEATAQVGDDTFAVTARVVTDADEREQLWELLTAAYPDFASYQALTDRVLPIGVLTRCS